MFKEIIKGVITIVVSVVISVFLVGNNQPKQIELRGTTNYDTIDVSDGYQVDGTTIINGDGSQTFTATTTIAKSPDGFVAWDDFTVATGTAKMVYTNPSNDMVCDGRSAYVQAIGTPFAPSLVFAIGTSTSATGYSTNLIASTTVATTTNYFAATTFVTPFRLKSGESIVGSLSDIDNSAASSTYYSNWNIQFGVHCWTIGL